MITGFLVDVYPDYKHDTMRLWIKTKHKPVSIDYSYHPSFYISASSSDLQQLHAQLSQHPDVKQLHWTMEKTTLRSEEKRRVLEITPMHLSSFHQLAKQIDLWGDYHRYQLYNVDLRIPTRFLQQHHLFFNAYVKGDTSQLVIDDDQWAVDYPVPEFSSCTFSIQQEKTRRITQCDVPLIAITIDDAVFEAENEIDLMRSALGFLHRIDPDILYTHQGDSMIFPTLCHHAKRQGMLSMLQLGRDPAFFLHPLKEEKSYMSYGRILHRPGFYMLKGRSHIDCAHSFFHMEGGLHGLIDLSRCSNISFQLLSRLGPGTAISQIQVNDASGCGYLIPYKKTIPEMWKSAATLLTSDRGGLIFEPMVGLHEQVIELDFASLYPNIMVNHNISPETLFCPCCHHTHPLVPQLGYWICTKQTGLLPRVLQPILHRRFLFKARAKNKRYEQKRYEQLQKTWKWVLIVCFGYTGYRNARYGRIECHESITAYSRDLLLKATEVVEHAGYQVLHGIVDSLWIQAKNPQVRPVRLARLIGQRTGVRVELEGQYHWIVFLPCKETGLGALNRYYGLFTTGILKTRGVELRQHNTPAFFKDVQQQVLAVFQQAPDKETFHHLIPKALTVLSDAACILAYQQVDPFDLVFTIRISKPLASYKVNTFATAALRQLARFDVHLKPGQIVQYLVSDEKTHIPTDRVCIKELLSSNTPIDRSFYFRYLAQCGETLLLPFGYWKSDLEQILFSRIREKC